MTSAEMTRGLESAFLWIAQSSLRTSVLIVLVFLVQSLLGQRLSVRWRYVLSLLVVLRLLMPWVPSSSVSIFNLGMSAPYVWKLTPVYEPIPPLLENRPQPGVLAGRAMYLPPSTVGRLSWQTLASWIWLSGFLGSLFIVCGQHRRFSRWVTTLPPIGNERAQAVLADCKKRMGVRQNVEVLAAPRLSTPALFGLRRPRLLIPPSVLERFDESELRMICLHELAHVRRADILLNWVVIVVRALHWFNPLVWAAIGRLRADRELVCDAMVIEKMGTDERHVYGSTLIKLLDEFSGAGSCPSLVPVINNKSEIKRRVTMIAQFKPVGRIALLFSAAIAVVLCSVTFTRAANPPKTRVPATVAGPENEDRHPELREQSIQELQKRLEDLDSRAMRAEQRVDKLRQELAIPSDVAEGGMSASGEAQTFRQLERERISVETNYRGQAELLRSLDELRTKGDREVQKAILTVQPDAPLANLLEQLWTTEATLAKLKVSLGPEHVEFKSISAMQADLGAKVNERIEGIISGLKVKLSASKAQMEALAQAIGESAVRDAKRAEALRPYFREKRELENLRRVRDTLQLRILQEQVDVALPGRSP